MAKKIQGKKLCKKTNNKKSFVAFIESGYKDLDLFKKACKDDENLLIYTCLKTDELVPFIEKIKDIEPVESKIKYLKDVKVQPFMNETEERFDICKDSIAAYLKNYIAYNGFVMNNGSGDAEDWTSEFWLKYTKICNFYRDRWFHREKLKKASTVKYNLMLYREFVYICRMSITGERRHQAFLATQHPEASIFKPSLDFNLDNNKSDDTKTLIDIVKDNKSDTELMVDNVHISHIQQRALDLSKEYENGKYTELISKFYEAQGSDWIEYEDITDRRISNSQEIPELCKNSNDINSKNIYYIADLIKPDYKLDILINNVLQPRNLYKVHNGFLIFNEDITEFTEDISVTLQCTIEFHKKIVILSKIFLYKAGLVSPKAVAFIKSLSNTYKSKFNISTALLNKQIAEVKKHKVHKQVTYADVLEDGGNTHLGLVLRKRGTI